MEPENSQQFKPVIDEHNAESHTATDRGGDCGGDGRSQAENKTLVTDSSDKPADSDLRFNSAHHLSEVPVKYALSSPLEVLVAVKDHVFQNHGKTLESIPGEAVQVENEGQLQSSNVVLQLQSSNDVLLPEVLAPSATQSISSITSPNQQNLSVSDNKVLVGDLDKENHNSSKHKSLSIVPVSKKPSLDGYNWRKYGQKHVKSPNGSRSYYRCTHCDCYAKKIECSDHNNHVIDIVYKTPHNHDPPNKVSCSPESRPSPVNGHSKTANSSTGPNDAVPFTSLKASAKPKALTSSLKEELKGGSDEKSEINVDGENTFEAETRKRLKNKSDPDSPEALSKAGKKPKLVVHAGGDSVISGDGFRWRKYGQKMVKGNPHPRNYYRCTSPGCPVRKHIERAVDNPNAAIITYKELHDHDLPVPRKLPSSPTAVIAATTVASPALVSSLQVKMCDQLQNQMPTIKFSVDKVGEAKSEMSEHGSDTTIASARTLMSVGSEIKPC